MEYSKKTKVTFSDDYEIEAKDLNSLVATVNELVVAINNAKDEIDSLNEVISNLKDELNASKSGYCDLVAEKSNRSFSISEAIAEIEAERRTLGFKLRFLNKQGSYVEYSFTGENIEDSSWGDINNWSSFSMDVIDGGEW